MHVCRKLQNNDASWRSRDGFADGLEPRIRRHRDSVWNHVASPVGLERRARRIEEGGRPEAQQRGAKGALTARLNRRLRFAYQSSSI
jgi:hypothetical protein